MPEVLTYGSFRAPVYRDYEQPWNKNYFNYGKFLFSPTNFYEFVALFVDIGNWG